MAEITIKNFNGLNLKEGLWDQNFSAYSKAMDFYGLGDDQTNISYTGVLQGGLALSSMAVSGAQLTNLISEFCLYTNQETTGIIYGIDANTSARIYKWIAGTPNWALDHSVSATSGTGVGNNMQAYGGNLYYTTGGNLGKLTSTATYDDSFQIGLTVTSPQPMKVFAGSLFIAHGQFVAKYDGSTFTLKKLTLPSDFVIRSMEVYRDGLYISADQSTQVGGYTRIFVWDGTSATFNDSFPLQNEFFAPSLQSAGGSLWLIGNRGGDASTVPATGLTPIYIFQPGSLPDLLFELPLRRNAAPGIGAPMCGVGTYQGGILLASSDAAAGSLYTEGSVSGVWYIGKDLTTGLFHASLYFDAGASVIMGAIYSSGRTQTGTVAPVMYASTNNSSTYKIFQAASPSVSDNFNGYNPTWVSLPMDAGSTKNKAWTYAKLHFDALTTSQAIKIEVRFNTGTFGGGISKTFNYDAAQSTTSPYADRFLNIPINRVARTISIRISFPLASTSTATPRVHSCTLYYEPFES